RSGLVGRARPQLLRCYAATELGADLPAGLTPKTNVRILTDTTKQIYLFRSILQQQKSICLPCLVLR
ncbi:hypothetical protein, partial [Bythopirellula polymerisocia]|uniref:hypothetical protein n=1 Tax=Bythopirellula polymerisocia TaxID=2528003 RepID=UPI001E5B923F